MMMMMTESRNRVDSHDSTMSITKGTIRLIVPLVLLVSDSFCVAGITFGIFKLKANHYGVYEKSQIIAPVF